MESNIESITQKTAGIVNKYAPKDISEFDKPLTFPPYSIDAITLTSVFLDIEHEFGVDLNKLFDCHMDFSINSISAAIETQLLLLSTHASTQR